MAQRIEGFDISPPRPAGLTPRAKGILALAAFALLGGVAVAWDYWSGSDARQAAGEAGVGSDGSPATPSDPASGIVPEGSGIADGPAGNATLPTPDPGSPQP